MWQEGAFKFQEDDVAMFSPGDFQSADDFSGCDRESLFGWIRECVFNDSSWPHYRRLFKLAEQILGDESGFWEDGLRAGNQLSFVWCSIVRPP